jgi:NagD protein
MLASYEMTEKMPQYPVRWITTELAVGYAPGSYNDLAAIRAQGVAAIVNLCAECYDLVDIEKNAGFDVYYIPIPDEKEVESYLKGYPMDALRSKKAFICDMDGVIYHGNQLLPGVSKFLDWLRKEHKKFLFLTNSSERSPRELREKMLRLTVQINEDHFYTSALATAEFLARQCPGGSAFVIGEAGLTKALYDAGFSMNDTNPDYVVVGETRNYSYDRLERAVHLVGNGAKLIGTNPDLTDPTEKGIVPATGALIAPIELATGSKAYFVGKPNPLMMRHALKRLGCRREETVIVRDRMDTDIIAGLESEIETVLVLSGVTSREGLERFAYRPRYILDGVGDIVP